MPILRIRALPQADPKLIQDALKQTCLAIAKEYGCPPQHVWATWQTIDPGFYVEGDQSSQAQPKDSHPPIAELLCFEGKSESEIARLLRVASQTLASCLNIPKNIFITYAEAKSGQVMSGEDLIRKK